MTSVDNIARTQTGSPNTQHSAGKWARWGLFWGLLNLTDGALNASLGHPWLALINGLVGGANLFIAADAWARGE